MGRSSGKVGSIPVEKLNNWGDTYQINPEEFAHKCQVYLSVGTTHHPAPNRKSGTEVLIQGNHMSYAAKLLQNDYKIPKKYVKIFEVKRSGGQPESKSRYTSSLRVHRQPKER